ncbi:DUF2806 domain-containing protein, partial [Gammaproteobacteria bacterium]|nr:DUF2806 domain-containing protein [Gammaproteobacteria bacterium]
RNERDVSELKNRAAHRVMHEETTKQANIENIARKAIPHLTANTKPEEIELDWLRNFFDKCKNISNEEMQEHWSRILSGEANNPGSISKKTIETFYLMEQKDALLYTKMLSYAWKFDSEHVVMIDDLQNNVFVKNDINFSTLTHLKDMGLIKVDSFIKNILNEFPKKINISYYNNAVGLEFTQEHDNTLNVGNVMLTKDGLELANIVNGKMDTEYFAYMKNKLSQQANLI